MDFKQSVRDKVLALLKSDQYKPMRIRDMAYFFGLEGEDKDMLKVVLDQLILEGKIAVNGRGRYGILKPQIKEGRFHASGRGFGFVSVEGMDRDVFIPAPDVKDAFQDDLVEIMITRPGIGERSAEGKILQVKERGRKLIPGIFHSLNNAGYVTPDDRKIQTDIHITASRVHGAGDNQRVLVEMINYGGNERRPQGSIREIFGSVDDLGAGMLSVIRGHGIPEEFPLEVLDYACRVPQEVTEEEKEGRLDLRSLPTVTIDGEDARDLDDAISLSLEDGIWHLGVHIADVSHYVTEGSILDREAYERGTSVYLPDRVIPMLPPELSNGICSLNAGQDRLAFSCLMEINRKGEIIGHRLAETLIHVDRRMTYTKVQQILDGDPESIEEYDDFTDMFRKMGELSGILREKRRARGSLDFDLPECRIVLDQGHVSQVKAYERTDATDLIEDFMLAANETVAEDAFWQELPFLYRIHEEPDAEKIMQLAGMIRALGYGLRTPGSNTTIYPKELQKLLAKASDTPEEAFISRLALRSMKRAKYSTQCTGHFGLAARYYCHFTSPIRRYPDLQIHRILRENLQGHFHDASGEERLLHYHDLLEDAAYKTSMLERRADEAEREADKICMAEYMSHRIGEIFTGIVTSVTERAIFISLENTIEGIMSVLALRGDIYEFDRWSMSLQGEMYGKKIEIGSRMKVQVESTDLQTGSIYFLPVYDSEDQEADEKSAGREKGREKGRKKSGSKHTKLGKEKSISDVR